MKNQNDIIKFKIDLLSQITDLLTKNKVSISNINLNVKQMARKRDRSTGEEVSVKVVGNIEIGFDSVLNERNDKKDFKRSIPPEDMMFDDELGQNVDDDEED